MSYLDRPRINFGGSFQASPATINNTPNNYNPANYSEDAFDPTKIELYWEPKGDSIFDLIECKVTSVEAPDDASDGILGTSVAALYTGAPPKLVDLDPMQQNCSEIWGMTMMVGDFGGAYVQGVFAPISFNGIWGISQGDNTPRNSASGAAIYQTTLGNLKWNVGTSKVLADLQRISPKRLSVRMVVSAHNNAPQLYAFTFSTCLTMLSKGVPLEVLSKIVSLQNYVMNVDANGNPKPPGRGYIPTLVYVNYLLAQLLGQSTAAQWGPTIVAAAQQPYQPWINYSTGEPLTNQPLFGYNYGKVVGSIGPCADDEPTYAVPARTLAPVPAPQRQTTSTPPPSPPSPAGWWAQAKLDTGDTPSLTIDLANSLPVPLPGRPLMPIGTLSLAYYTGSGDSKQYTPFGPSIDYTDPNFIDEQAGMLVVTDFGGVDPKSLESLPIAVRRTDTSGKTTTFLEENPEGLSMRADQFVFRMNPGMQTTPTFRRGETNTVDIHVRKFGQIAGTENLQIALAVLEPDAAVNYTLSTLGTSNTNGIDNLSTPTGKLSFSSSATVSDGKATFTLTATDPGNPRAYIDGQVYMATYDFSPQVEGFQQDPNDVVSAQIYQQTPISGTPTWTNGIGDILRQYGMLYPIMGRFELWTYEGVVANREKIERVLSADMSQPLHMPVSRDLSAIRCQLVLDWFKAGMPQS